MKVFFLGLIYFPFTLLGLISGIDIKVAVDFNDFEDNVKIDYYYYYY